MLLKAFHTTRAIKHDTMHAIQSCSIFTIQFHTFACVRIGKVYAENATRIVSRGLADRFIPVTNTDRTLPRSPVAERRDSSHNPSPVQQTHYWAKEIRRTCANSFHKNRIPSGRRSSSCRRIRCSSGTAWCFPAPLLRVGGGEHGLQRDSDHTETPSSRFC